MSDTLRSQILTLFIKDLKIEYRNRRDLSLIVLFSIATGAIIGYVSKTYLYTELSNIVGMFALALFFISVFAAFKSFINEVEKGTIYGLLLSPVSPSIIFYSKLLFNLFLILSMGILVMLCSSLFSGGMIIVDTMSLLGIFSIGIYSAAVSSFSSAIGIYIESKGLLVPLMIFTLSLPAMLFYISSIYINMGLLVLSILGISYGLVMSPLIEFIMSED